jgi:hypothetical protein
MPDTPPNPLSRGGLRNWGMSMFLACIYGGGGRMIGFDEYGL